MNAKNLLLLPTLLIGLCLASCATGSEAKAALCGVWDPNPHPPDTIVQTFSWGEGPYVPNGSLVIDTYGNNNSIFLPALGGPFPIRQVLSQPDGTIQLRFFFDRGNFEATVNIHFDGSGRAIWFETVDRAGFAMDPILTGKTNLWYRISGPRQR